MKPLMILLAAVAIAVAGRSKLVHILTATTGTWVGTPENG